MADCRPTPYGRRSKDRYQEHVPSAVYNVHDNQLPLALVLAARHQGAVPSPPARAYLKATLSEIRITGELLKLSGSNTSMAGLTANYGTISAEAAVAHFIPDWCVTADEERNYSLNQEFLKNKQKQG